jgi:poly(3-hydroxybutyrate) depolymerase
MVDIWSAPKITPAQAAANCKSANGNAYNSYFQTQIYAGVWGDKDTMVLPAHNEINAKAFALLYNAPYTNPYMRSVTGGGNVKEYGLSGNNSSEEKKVVYTMLIPGMGHTWPAGTDAPKKNVAYVDSTRANYPADVTEWFFKNNRRVVTLPPPTNLACPSKTDNSITLSWGAVTGASGYSVSRSGNVVGTPNATGFTDSGLNSGTNYTYSVRATANSSSGAEALITCKTTGNPPPISVLPAPGGLSGSSTSESVTLSWNAVADAKGYNVYRNGSLLGFTATTSYTASGLAASTSYTFAVTTVNVADVESASPSSLSVITKPNVLYTDVKTDTVVNHYAQGRLTLQQYLGFGAKIGYIASLTLYKCGSTWTNQVNCSAMQI